MLVVGFEDSQWPGGITSVDNMSCFLFMDIYLILLSTRYQGLTRH